MSGISIQIRDSATPALQKLRAEYCTRGAQKVMARAGTNLVQQHLRGLDRTRRNELGGKRSHFYSSAARGTNYLLAEDGIHVQISSIGIAQRYFGGTITPVKGKFLTIPADPRAYGRRAREFPDLYARFPKKHGTGVGYLYIAGPKRQLTILYWLVKSVTQRPDPGVLPATNDLGSAMTGAAERYIRLQWERAHG